MNLYINGTLVETAPSWTNDLDHIKTWAEMNSRPGDVLEIWDGLERLVMWLSPEDAQ